MHWGFVGSYWWVVVLAMAVVMVGFIAIAGRSAQGGVGARTKLGWQKWQALSRKTGEVQARVVLSIIYFTAVVPFGLAQTYLADPLRCRGAHRDRTWLPRRTRDLTLADAQRQF